MVTVTPVLLGDGTRLFEHPGGETVRLEQLSVSHIQQVTNLWYRVVDSTRQQTRRSIRFMSDTVLKWAIILVVAVLVYAVVTLVQRNQTGSLDAKAPDTALRVRPPQSISLRTTHTGAHTPSALNQIE